MSALQLQEPAAIHTNLQSCDLTMKGKVNTGAEKVNHAKSTNMVSQEVPPCARTSRTPRKAATFGKRSNSMRRNPKAEVHKAGWLYKQASSGVKQWNKRWFVLSDRCLFYYKDEKEDAVLGSLPLLSFRIGGVQPSDNITRKFAFKAEHAGTRTYYFSTDSYEEQKEWIAAMSQAAEVNVNPSQRSNTAVTPERTMVTRDGDPQIEVKQQITANQNDNGVDNLETPPLSTSCSDQSTVNNSARQEDCGGKMEDEGGGGPACGHAQSNHNPNGWSHHYPTPQNHKSQPPQAQNHSTGTPQRQAGGGVQPPDDTREQHPNVVLRRGFVPRTGPERVAQRKSSMAQLQHWVNQRRVMLSQEDINSPSHYYPANQGFNYYGYPSGGPQYLEEYQLYPPGVRPDSICSAAGAYDHRWAVEDKRRSLRDGPHQVYPRDSWGAQYYGGVDVKSLRRLSIQPRSRSVPRSPSLSSGGAYSPVAHNFASPARSPSARFDRFSGRMRDDGIYADPSVYNLRRSLSSPKYDYSGDRRSINQGLYHHHHNHHNYPVSPSIHNKMDDILDLQLRRNLDYLDQQVLEGSRLIGMVTRRVERSSSAAKLCIQVPPFHDVYRELHPTLKLNEIETSKLLGRLCEQNHIVKDHEAVVHRLRMDKDSLEEALVATHQEMEKYQNQPVAMEKLHIKKETLQKQLINIRGELSQASNALTTTRMEFEALEEEAHAIHGDLWEQLNAGIQSELVRRHIQKEFWRVQDVLEGLHKNHSSRGTDTAKHKVASGASGSFSTNSPASPLSSVSLTSPLGPYSPVPGSQVSPSKQLGPEVSTGHTQRGVHPFSTPVSHSRSKPTPKPRPKSCVVPQFDTESSPKTRPTSYREPDKSTNAEKMNAAVSCECAFPPSALVLQSLNESSGRLDTVIEETTDQSIASRFGKASKATHIDFLQVQCQDSTSNQHSDLVQDHMQLQDFAWIRSNICSQEVKVGQRKDVFPDTIHASPLLVEYPNGEGNRHFTVPESPILLFQDIFQTNVLTSCHGPDFPLADTQQHQQVFHPTRHAKMPARPYDQTEPHADPMLCMVTQSDSSSQPSDKVFMQTHL